VNSADVQQGNDQGIGKNKRTGEYIGGGAVLGTLLGAIAGGGKGAAIGAAAGAAAGGTAQVLTRGKEVKIPAESNLRFRLDNPCACRLVRKRTDDRHLWLGRSCTPWVCQLRTCKITGNVGQTPGVRLQPKSTQRRSHDLLRSESPLANRQLALCSDSHGRPPGGRHRAHALNCAR